MFEQGSFLVGALAVIAANVALLGLFLQALATLIRPYEKHGRFT